MIRPAIFAASLLMSGVMIPAMAGAQVPASPQGAAPIATISGTRLDISAEGAVTRVPDVATITAGVVTQAPTAATAMAENARRMAAASAALRRSGVADRDIRTASISLQPQYKYGENRAPELTGYQASNQLSVRFRDVKRAGAILDALVGQGINQIGGPDFSLDEPEAALDEARVKAVQAARARAELYAKAAGLSVVRMLSISESSDYRPPVRPMMMMARGAAPEAADSAIEPGEQKLSVTVAISFELR